MNKKGLWFLLASSLEKRRMWRVLVLLVFFFIKEIREQKQKIKVFNARRKGVWLGWWVVVAQYPNSLYAHTISFSVFKTCLVF